MKAIVSTRYGSPNVLQLQEVAKPTPRDYEVLVRVHTAIVGPVDCVFRKGDPFLIRLPFSLTRPGRAILGVEFAGEIEAAGRAVQAFQPGDQVFGMSPDRSGAHAEYLCLPEDQPLALKSARMTYEEAVGICDGAPTALIFLRQIAKVKPGQKVLINGASGSVGTAAVQLARYFEAEVTGVCSTANGDMVKSLGADQVIDYTREDFTTNGQAYDVIFDAVGKSSFSQCRGSLTPGGVYLSTALTTTILLQMFWTRLRGGKQARFVTAGLMQKKENLLFLKELFEAGKLKAVIDKRYPLEQMAEAHRYVETGHKRGNVVITVGPN